MFEKEIVVDVFIIVSINTIYTIWYNVPAFGYERPPPPRRQRRRKNFRIRMLPPLMGPQNLPLPMKKLLTPPHGLGPLAHVCDRDYFVNVVKY